MYYQPLESDMEGGREKANGEILDEVSLKAEARMRKHSIVKNLLLVSVSLMLLFTASQSVDKLQSSVHFQDELGTTTLSVVNALNLIASFFVAAWAIKRMGPKFILVASMWGYIAYIVVNFWATWYTLIPVAVVMGIASALLYAALWTYIGTIGQEYSELTGLGLDIVNARFYGLFFMFIQSASIWGNIISFVVLDEKSNGTTNAGDMSCGAQFCDANVSKEDAHFEGVPKNFYLLCGIFVGVSIVAFILGLFLSKQNPIRDEETSILKGIIETAKKVPDPYMLLVVIITIYGGIQFAFISGDYTKAYITCSFGVANVGYIFICFGVVSTIFSMVVGHLVKYLGRIAVFIITAFLDVGIYATLAYYDFRSHAIIVHFVIIGLLGITNSVWQGQVKALYGSLFPDCREVAFSLLGVFEAFGICLGFAYSGKLCTLPKLYILFALLIFGMAGYGCIEIILRRRSRTNEIQPQTSN